jgi:hypothetical protein
VRVSIFDPVTGEECFGDCHTIRGIGGKCGKEAILFEPKPDNLSILSEINEFFRSSK